MPPATFELFNEGFMPMPEIKRWTLVGGTALAIHYRHRLSEDLDFFIENSTLEQDRKRIDKMMEHLEENGFDVTKLQENDTQVDFEISGVKVTFYASSLGILKNGSISFENVTVAGIETIKVMKMDAVLNHRTLTRDFFDIATIMSKKRSTIFDLLDSYACHYSKKLSPRLVLERLIQKDFDLSDPGLTPMKPKSSLDTTKFRQELATQIRQQAQKDTKSIDAVIDDSSSIEKYLDRKFGLGRMNLPQKLATLQEDTLVLEALKAGNFDIAYGDISGKTLLDHYLEDDMMFVEVLNFAKRIPDEWLQSRTFKRYEKDRLIALENSVISCTNNKHNSKEKIERIAGKHGIETKELLKRIEDKEKVLRRSL